MPEVPGHARSGVGRGTGCRAVRRAGVRTAYRRGRAGADSGAAGTHPRATDSRSLATKIRTSNTESRTPTLRLSDSPTSEVSSTPEAPTLPDLLRRRRATVQTEISRERVSYYLSRPIIDAVERLTLELSLELGKRVTKADVVDGLLTLGLDQRTKLVREIRKSKGL